MKTFDVIVEQKNGSYRALVPALPNILAEGATRDEAISNVKNTAQHYLAGVEVATVELDERSIEEGRLLTEEEERAQLIEVLENMKPQTELGATLRTLRLQMLREGQRLRSLDEINRDLGREDYADA
ncbi:MAG: type II toxin-antitoxin system HicB family antitoxin [Blastocatellia bacterium]